MSNYNIQYAKSASGGTTKKGGKKGTKKGSTKGTKIAHTGAYKD